MHLGKVSENGDEDRPDDDEEDEDNATGVVEVLEIRLVEFTREATETLVVEGKWEEETVLVTKHVRRRPQMRIVLKMLT